jgi:Dual specificity phosphatase, catalytic domain
MTRIDASPRTGAKAWQPNLSWLTPHLAVGGSFPIERAEHLAKTLGVRAVVDLRMEACDDESVLKRHGLTFLHLPTEDHCAVSEPMLRNGVAFVNRHVNKGERVLIHCEHGIGRSATLALCVLVSRGLEPLEALDLAKTRRALVSPSPPQYEAWALWLRAWKAGREVTWQVPHFDAFAEIAYRHLRSGSG